MDLQQQFESIFSSIPYGDTKQNLLEADVIYGCVVNDDFAKVTMILPENSPLRQTLPQQIEEKIILVHILIMDH